MSEHILWYNKPASEWNEALPIGNGRLGAMIFGTLQTEQFQLNEDSVWYGGHMDRNNPDALEHLPKIRQLILNNQIQEAEQLMLSALSGVPQSMRTYQTLGEFFLNFLDHNGIPEKYRRELDIEHARHSVSYTLRGHNYTRETFSSAPAQVIIIRLTTDCPEGLTFSTLLKRGKFYDFSRRLSDCSIMIGGNLGADGSDFGSAIKVCPVDGTLQLIGERITVKNTHEVMIYVAGATTYRCEDVQELLTRQLNAASDTPFITLYQEHIADYQKLYSRVSLQLTPGRHTTALLSTDLLLQSISTGYPDPQTEVTAEIPGMPLIPAADICAALTELYFNFGRYLLISCSRPGTLPANLQGIWNKEMAPPWDSKFTININTEMNYWPAEICNLPECHEPLFDQIRKMLPNGQITAKKMYHCRGFVAHHNTDIWGDTAVQDLWVPGSYWVMGAAWLCTHIYTHYEYGQDTAFLASYYPVMKEAATFFMDFLIEKDGYLVTCPSVSPENTFILPDGKYGANTYGVTMDNQILRDLFTDCIAAAKTLGRPPEEIQSYEQILNRLIPTQIGKYGQIMEWSKDYEEKDKGHRHISHLYGLHPSSQITVDQTPELARAARITLERRLANGGGHTGWSRAWIMNHYAKLWDGNTAFENLKQLWIRSTLPNLLDNHPPFQIDGNFGAAAGIAFMLVQSTCERTVLLPALPDEWSEGQVSGLRIRGGAHLSLRWTAHRLEQCEVVADADIHTRIVYENSDYEISLKKGEKKLISMI